MGAWQYDEYPELRPETWVLAPLLPLMLGKPLHLSEPVSLHLR